MLSVATFCAEAKKTQTGCELSVEGFAKKDESSMVSLDSIYGNQAQ